MVNLDDFKWWLRRGIHKRIPMGTKRNEHLTRYCAVGSDEGKVMLTEYMIRGWCNCVRATVKQKCKLYSKPKVFFWSMKAREEKYERVTTADK